MAFTTQHGETPAQPVGTPFREWFGMRRCYCESCGFLVFAYVGKDVNGSCPDCGSSQLIPTTGAR
jgi:hypothetical protein